jgi:hypothetical protein
LALLPPFYEQFVEVRRQQFAQHPQARSPQYEKLLADLNASIADWHDWRERHPGPGTLAVLRAKAKWLVPWFVTVANPTLLAQPFISALVIGAFDKYGKAAAVEGLYDRWRTRITVRSILKDGGVKRRG